MSFITKVFINLLAVIRFLPHIIILNFHPKHEFLKLERNVWIRVIKNEEVYSLSNFLWLLQTLPEYRSVFYLRIGSKVSFLLNFFAKQRIVLQFDTLSEKIGIGFVVQHGFSTIVNATCIGEYVQIWHNVTIGTNRSHSGNLPVIGDNVKICAGAIVIGAIVIGDNVTIGAGAVVTKSVPNNSIVVGNPARILSRFNS